MVPTIVKIANWIRTKRVSIYWPPSVGWLVAGVAPGTGAPWSAGGAADGGGPGSAGAVRRRRVLRVRAEHRQARDQRRYRWRRVPRTAVSLPTAG